LDSVDQALTAEIRRIESILEHRQADFRQTLSDVFYERRLSYPGIAAILGRDRTWLTALTVTPSKPSSTG
jgi:hypothetical protein